MKIRHTQGDHNHKSVVTKTSVVDHAVRLLVPDIDLHLCLPANSSGRVTYQSTILFVSCRPLPYPYPRANDPVSTLSVHTHTSTVPTILYRSFRYPDLVLSLSEYHRSCVNRLVNRRYQRSCEQRVHYRLQYYV